MANAIVRIPGHNLGDGLTTADLGKPVHAIALQQHRAYCEALERCGLRVMTLDCDLQHPDSAFVEDTAVLTGHAAVLTRPGAMSRQGEVAGIRKPLEYFFSRFYEIKAPGTLEGGDICEAGNHFFIGISRRTNEEGARQLAVFLAQEGYTSSFIDIRSRTDILHLKSGISYIGDNHMVIMQAMAGLEPFRKYELMTVAPQESYAANCVRINDYTLLPAGFPGLESSLKTRGFKPYPLSMSEFQKMDGGLSCLSLRF